MFVLEQEEYMREGENFGEISEMTFHELTTFTNSLAQLNISSRFYLAFSFRA